MAKRWTEKPTYELATIRALVEADRWIIEKPARDRAYLLTFGVQDVRDCVLSIRDSDFRKTAPDLRPGHEGMWQDVYFVPWELDGREFDLYLKLQIGRGGDAVVIQFKQQGSPE